MNAITRKLIGQVAGLFVVFAIMLFVPAGTIAWPAGWIFLVLFFGFVAAVSAWLLRHDPALLAERMSGTIRSGQKGWDRVLIAVVTVLFACWMILMPLDAVRFRWSQMPIAFQIAGAFLLLVSFVVFFQTFRENPYLSPVVRDQAERGQTVISSGPYRYVRHPMYAGFVLYAIGTPLLLGSVYGIPGALVLIAMVAIRAMLEEKTLQEELPGYGAYMQRVRYRLIPFIW
jgi:protein-S-isoprenylcysteine O-methyltransferase Ste14